MKGRVWWSLSPSKNVQQRFRKVKLAKSRTRSVAHYTPIRKSCLVDDVLTRGLGTRPPPGPDSQICAWMNVQHADSLLEVISKSHWCHIGRVQNFTSSDAMKPGARAFAVCSHNKSKTKRLQRTDDRSLMCRCSDDGFGASPRLEPSLSLPGTPLRASLISPLDVFRVTRRHWWASGLCLCRVRPSVNAGGCKLGLQRWGAAMDQLWNMRLLPSAFCNFFPSDSRYSL